MQANPRNNTWPEGAPSPYDHDYHCFTADHNEEEAAAVFVERQGREPEWVIEHQRMLWLGPKDAA